MSPPVRRDPFLFEVRSGEPIRGDAWRPAGAAPEAAIVVCHGFKGFKDWGFFPWTCESLAARTDLPVISFDFAGAGVGEDPETFTDLDGFSRNTLSRELEDLEAVLDRLAAGRAGDLRLRPVSRFGLLGHSRGGAIAILKTALRTQVRALVTWAALASTGRYEESYAAELERDGIVHIPNVRTGQMMPLRRNVLDDIRAHRDRLDPLAAAARIRVPWLLLHGDEDESVPVTDGLALARAGGRLEVLAGTGHTFGAAHPFTGAGAALERAMSLTADHLRAHLSEA